MFNNDVDWSGDCGSDVERGCVSMGVLRGEHAILKQTMLFLDSQGKK